MTPARAALVVEWLAHVDAGDRRVWTAGQDERPLSDLGRRQAAVLCEALAVAPFDALYSSAALRARQTIEPLALRFGLPIKTLPGLHEIEGWLPPPPWRTGDFPVAPLGGAYAAGRAVQALDAIRAEHPSGRVAAATHGDILPSLIVYLVGAHGLDLPAPNPTRGGWYTLVFDERRVLVQHHGVLPGFPQS